MDHDQRFKTLLQICFEDFMRLFFAEWAEHFDFEQIEWLTNETFPAPPDGERKVLDLVAKMKLLKPFKGMQAEKGIVVVHCEIDSSTGTVDLTSRMPYYYFPLRFDQKCPVLPIGLFLKVGLDGIGILKYEETFGSLTPLKFEFLYVGLPVLKAIEYVQGENLLGVALSALMDIPKERVVELGAEALRRIHNSDASDQKKFLLGECFEAYLPIDDDEKALLKGILRTDTKSEVKAMNVTSYDMGRIDERLSLREVLKRRLEKKFESEGLRWFGQLPTDIDLEQIAEIIAAAETSQTIQDLKERTGFGN